MRWAKSHPRSDIFLQPYECRRIVDVTIFQIMGHPEPIFHGSWITTHRILVGKHKQVAIHAIQVFIACAKQVGKSFGHTISTPFRNRLRDHTKQNQREPNSSSSIFVLYTLSLLFQGHNIYSRCQAGQIFIVINYDQFINKFVVKKDYPWSASHVLQRKDPSCLNQQVQNITTTTKQKREDSTKVSSLFYPLFESFIMIMYFHIIIFSYILIFRLFIQGTLFALNQIPSSLKAFRCSSQPSC